MKNDIENIETETITLEKIDEEKDEVKDLKEKEKEKETDEKDEKDEKDIPELIDFKKINEKIVYKNIEDSKKIPTDEKRPCRDCQNCNII